MNNLKCIDSEILSIEIAEYKLYPKCLLNAKMKSKSSRVGFLIKINFKSLGAGYSDCFSWPELGDIPIQEQISNLANGNYNSQLKKSIYFAYQDAFYRSKELNIFENLVLPKNHFTCTNIDFLKKDFIEKLKIQGFSKIKLKCGHDLLHESNQINNLSNACNELEIKLRLDFNASCSLREITLFLNKIHSSLKIIDLIEDPCFFLEQDWVQLKKLFPEINLALDKCCKDFLNDENQINKPFFDSLVLKPAVQFFSPIFANVVQNSTKQILFTSYMDHPLGQLTALYEASLFFTKNLQLTNECGFLTNTL